MKSLVRDAAILALATFLLYHVQGDLVRRHLTSEENLQDTIVWTITVLIAVVVIFGATFVLEALVITPYRLWREKTISWFPSPGLPRGKKPSTKLRPSKRT
jgi:hypothetical protein